MKGKEVFRHNGWVITESVGSATPYQVWQPDGAGAWAAYCYMDMAKRVVIREAARYCEVY